MIPNIQNQSWQYLEQIQVLELSKIKNDFSIDLFVLLQAYSIVVIMVSVRRKQ